MKKFKKGDIVNTKYGRGKVLLEDEDSLTVVVELENGDQTALPRFQVRKAND